MATGINRVIDSDSHLIEGPTMYQDYTEKKNRDLALGFAVDELGYECLTYRGEILMPCHMQIPDDHKHQADFFKAQRTGQPAPYSTFGEMPAHYIDPAARREFVKEWGADASILFPNWALFWERMLRDYLEAMQVNMAAWNRWAIDVQAEGKGHLYPTGYVILEDLDWAEKEMRTLAAGGIRAVKLSVGPAQGKRLSHPDFDRIWSLYEELDLATLFHVGSSYNRPMGETWTEGDPLGPAPLMSFVLQGSDIQLVLADLIVRGTLERHPKLRIGIMELGVDWLELFLAKLDEAVFAHKRFTGADFANLPMEPSKYVARQVRFGTFPFEDPVIKLEKQLPPVLMMGGDFPHTEGDPDLKTYMAKTGTMAPELAEAFYRGNAAFLLGMD